MKAVKNISIFENHRMQRAPLAEQLRPKSWAGFLGISRLPHDLAQRLESGQGKVPSLIVWGPPGSGKTTLARLIGQSFNCSFLELSAVLCGVADIRQAAVQAASQSQPTLVFLDEIHRLNRGQQDALLPHLEGGTFALIGATTENPSFHLSKALLSRCNLVVLDHISTQDLLTLAKHAAAILDLGLSEPDLSQFCEVASGDGRRLCNLIELYSQSSREPVNKFLKDSKILSYDRNGEDHYNIVSAFIKSMRGSDPDAALYWCFRMLESGEDPAFILRRMIIFASEDIGNADPRALPLAISTAEAFERVGLPEGRIPLAQCVIFLATAPKSNRSYEALNAGLAAIKHNPNLAVPIHLRNAETDLMRELGYGENYKYPHHQEAAFEPDQQYLPDALAGRKFYYPTMNGYEKNISERMAFRKSLNLKGGQD